MWKKPTFLIDIKKVMQNIERMQQKALKSGVEFRPHFKTHQNLDIAKLFREKGIHKITVSSVSMARFFAQVGWNDITIAFPVNLLEIREIDQLASEIDLNLLVESAHSAETLANKMKSAAGIFIKIDSGYHRTGLQPGELIEITKTIQLIETSGKLVFKGFLTHAGHTYSASSLKEIELIYQSAAEQLNRLKIHFTNNFPDLILSYGDTPSCSIVQNLSEVDEIRPGNFVYFDVMQLQIGSCTIDEIACTVACPVVAVNKERNEVVIYGGAVHLSKEFIIDKYNQKVYGLVAEISNIGRSETIEGAYVKSLSQEHGVVHIPEAFKHRMQAGNIIGIIPVHSCLTANLLKEDTVLLY